MTDEDAAQLRPQTVCASCYTPGTYNYLRMDAVVAQPAAAAVNSADPATVLQTIQGALTSDNATRNTAEQLLRGWEADAAPGFMASLLQIVASPQAIDEPFRLLAAVIAKNAVGSSWRKTLGTREWNRVPEQEKEGVRQVSANCLLQDPSERVATQLSLLISNIAQFDFPAHAPTLLEGLAAAAVWRTEDGPPPPGRLRALKALRRVLAGLATKRFVIEPSKLNTGLMGMADLQALSRAIGAERELFKTKLAELFAPVAQQFSYHAQAFLQGTQLWQFHGPAAKAAITCLAELAAITQHSDQLPNGCNEVLSIAYSCMSVSGATPPPGVVEADMWRLQWGKLVERICRLLIVYLDTQPLAFAEFMPRFLPLVLNSALLATPVEEVRAMRAKRRVLLIRFIAKTMLCPFYRPEWVSAPGPPVMTPLQAQQLALKKQHAIMAHSVLEAHLQGQQVAQLIQAVITKYIALTPEELEEWREDPESYARSMDVESGPDADTPRPIGVGLLLCMLERGQEPVAKALIELATQLQQAGPAAGLEGLLMREATYRVIGEGFAHVSPHISFSAWYANELAPLLSSRSEAAAQGRLDVSDSVLQARALWLVGVCGPELRSAGEWNSALRLVAAHLAAQDLVVALTAMSSCLALAAQILEDQSLLEQADTEARRAKGNSGIPGLVQALNLGDKGAGSEPESDEWEDEQKRALLVVRHRVQSRSDELQAVVDPAIRACFSLLARLDEVESMVRVLQLVSVLVEVLGHRIKPQLPIIAAALPQIWQAATQHSSTRSTQGSSLMTAAALASHSNGSTGKKDKGEAGAVVRLHSALLAVLTHLVGKLRGTALADAQVAGVVYPLLDFATNLGSAESECLVEEAFRLWTVTLSSLPEVPPQLIALLPHLAVIMKRGRDNTAAYPLLESYLLLGATQSVIPLMGLIQGTMVATLQSVEEAALASIPQAPHAPALTQQHLQQAQAQGMGLGPAAKPGGGPAGQPPGGPAGAVKPFTPESAAEAMAAAALADVMLQLSPTEVPTLLAPTFSAMIHVVAHPALPASGVNVKVVNMLEGFVEVLGRVFMAQPEAFDALLAAAHPGDASTSQAQAGAAVPRPPGPRGPSSPTALFLDKWLTVASTRFVEEVVGIKTMAMLGRYRRRIATASLASMVLARVPSLCSQLLSNPHMLTRVVGLAVAAVMDDADFHSDQADLDALDFKNDLGEDSVLARRLSLTRNDPVRRMNLVDTVRNMLLLLATACCPAGTAPTAVPGGASPGGSATPPPQGVEALVTLVSAHASPRLAERVAALISGQLGKLFAEESEDDEQMARCLDQPGLVTDLSD